MKPSNKHDEIVDECYKLLLLHGFHARKGFRTLIPDVPSEEVFDSFIIPKRYREEDEKTHTQLDLVAIRFAEDPDDWERLGLEVHHKGNFVDAVSRLNKFDFLDYRVVVTSQILPTMNPPLVQIVSKYRFEEWLKERWEESCPLHIYEDPPPLSRDEDGWLRCDEEEYFAHSFMDLDSLVYKYERYWEGEED